MERLTFHDNTGNARLLGVSYGNGNGLFAGDKDVLERLAAYEDAEEQGLLVRLPCKVGDKVYVMHFMDGAETRIEAQTVTEISNACDGWYISTMTHGVGGIYSFDSIGIVWWLTREEAEAALAKEE